MGAAARDGLSITDGDGLRLAGERVRLWGIDAPELGQVCRRGGVLPFHGAGAGIAIKTAEFGCREQGKPGEARELIAPIYGWFTEGFDTPDLKGAKAVLDELTDTRLLGGLVLPREFENTP